MARAKDKGMINDRVDGAGNLMDESPHIKEFCNWLLEESGFESGKELLSFVESKPDVIRVALEKFD